MLQQITVGSFLTKLGSMGSNDTTSNLFIENGYLRRILILDQMYYLSIVINLPDICFPNNILTILKKHSKTDTITIITKSKEEKGILVEEKLMVVQSFNKEFIYSMSQNKDEECKTFEVTKNETWNDIRGLKNIKCLQKSKKTLGKPIEYYFLVNNGNIVATDARRLFVGNFAEWHKADRNKDIRIPYGVLNLLGKEWKYAAVGEELLFRDSTGLQIRTGLAKFDYPDWYSIMKQKLAENCQEVSTFLPELASFIEKALWVENNDKVTIQCENNRAKIVSHNKDTGHGFSSSDFGQVSSVDNAEASFNGMHLLRWLKVVESSNFKLKINSTSSTIYFTDNGNFFLLCCIKY